MKYAITLDPSIAKLHGWTGTRRRECTFADGSKKVLVFSRKAVELDELPPEIAADAKLIVKELPDAPATAAEPYDDGILELPTEPDKKGDRVQKQAKGKK